MKHIKGTFGTVYNPMTEESFVDLELVAKTLAENWGNIPKYLGDRKAYEIHLLARAYLIAFERRPIPWPTEEDAKLREDLKV